MVRTERPFRQKFPAGFFTHDFPVHGLLGNGLVAPLRLCFFTGGALDFSRILRGLWAHCPFVIRALQVSRRSS
jgi:hypothetical protein